MGVSVMKYRHEMKRQGYERKERKKEQSVKKKKTPRVEKKSQKQWYPNSSFFSLFSASVSGTKAAGGRGGPVPYSHVKYGMMALFSSISKSQPRG